MGSGKSTIGKLVAKKLGLQFVEMDDKLVEKSGEKSVNEIFGKHGEVHFRALEIATAKNLENQENVVIATGGGVILNKIILDYLKQGNGKIVYLQTQFNTIEHRLEGDTTRPLFQDKAKAKNLYAFRESLYKQYADIIITTDNKTKDEVTEEIIKNI